MKKICSKCKEEKDLEDFHKDRKRPDGRRATCKSCRSVLPVKKVKPTKYKLCCKCHQKKSIAEFHKHKYSADGRRGICKICRSLHRPTQNYSPKTPEQKMYKLIRNRLSLALRSLGVRKSRRTIEYLGCDQRTLLEWLQWSGERYDHEFNILDYDRQEYHIDHIKTFADVQSGNYTLDEVAHYTNLQILTATENLEKGGTSWVE